MDMEADQNPVYLDFELQNLKCLVNEIPQQFSHLKAHIQTMRLGLRFFKMLYWGLTFWEKSEYNGYLHSVFNAVVPILCHTAEELRGYIESVDEWGMINLELISYHLDKRIKQCQKHAKKICCFLLSGTLECKPCQCTHESFLEYGRETSDYVGLVLENVRDLLNSSVALVDPVRQQIVCIQQKLEELGKFVTPINDSITQVKTLYELVSCTRTWANRVSCLACLHWIDGMNECIPSPSDTMLSDLDPLVHKTIPCCSGEVSSYLQHTMIPQLLGGYYDFLLKDLDIPKQDEVERLREGLIILLSFVVDPPEDDLEDREVILAQIYAILNEVPCLLRSSSLNKMKECNFEDKFSRILRQINRVKGEVREVYVKTRNLSTFNSPKTNAVRFLDSLLKKLKKMSEEKVNSFPSIKYQVGIVHRELGLLRPFLQNNIGLQNMDANKDLSTQIINVVHYAAYITKFCHARSFSIWYGITFLQDVIENIRLVKMEIRKIEDYKAKRDDIPNKIDPSIAVSPQATTSTVGVFIGFEEDSRSIIDHLIKGTKDLTIISISGMPGQGKTTFAKQIYNDPEIQYHFHRTGWCYVSKGCEAKDLLIKIGCELSDFDANLELKDLIGCLRKSFKQKRYFLVMDDIWDVDVWNQVQLSFPDDKNGSRILFTTRNDNLALQAKPNSISHHLPLFTDRESWQLMNAKLFSGCGGAPHEFMKIAEQIASLCRGLPLAVALIASLLLRMEQKLYLWTKVAENLKSHLGSEGCRNIIELSYEYLSDHLKSCFLYFGAFPRGKNVNARTLKQLWMAEQFVEDNEMQSSKDLANKYLDDLVSQNLVVLVERNSTGEIKTCNVHDLLFDFCLEKANEDNFFHWAERSLIEDADYSGIHKYSHHRLCIGKIDRFIKPRPIRTSKELPSSQTQTCLWFQHFGFNFDCLVSYTLIDEFLRSFKVLVILDLISVHLDCDTLPEVILSMIHLRYLALWVRDNFNGISPSITNSLHLETLIIRGLRFRDSLPVSMWKMKSLRHVHLPSARLHLENFQETTSFAAGHIERLGELGLDFDNKTQEFLKKLPKLRKLVCCPNPGKEGIHFMWFSMFGSLTQLESLRINCGFELFVPDEKYFIFKFPTTLMMLKLFRLQLP